MLFLYLNYWKKSKSLPIYYRETRYLLTTLNNFEKMAETTKPTIHPNLQKFISSYDTSKIDYLNLVDDIPEYDVRSDYHQSQSTCTICFYIKNIMPNTFKYTLNKNGLTMRFQFDKNLRRAKIVQKLPEIPSSIKKITLTLTKIEIILNKNNDDKNGQPPIQYNLPDFEQELKESIEMEKALQEELDEFDQTCSR